MQRSSPTLVCSTLVMALLVMSTGTSGSKDVLTVRRSLRSCDEFFLTVFCWSSDVINVSGHRLSTAEIESALITHKGVAETAVIGTADELTGQAVYAFVTLKP